MSGILNVGTSALKANQTVLQVIGNNIANVNTPGYSRQVAVLQTVPGQYTGGGYVGKGVDVLTIQRTYSEFLTRQAALVGSTSAGDTARADKLKQLEGIFPGGTSGLGASISDMMNAFSDVANAPTDLTARTVALTRVSEAASRLRSASASLDGLQMGVTQELDQKVSAINNLAASIAAANEQIARVQGTGQPPNDLLDRRDQLVRDLNKYIQTSSIPADDGTVGIFIGGSQALVLGSKVSPVKLVADEFGDPSKSKLAITLSGQTFTLDEAMLGGGEVSGLLRFQNTDLVEGRNLLGRLTLAMSTAMNDQHKLGLDLDGNVGGNLFSPTDLHTASNVLAPTSGNSSLYTLKLDVSDITKFAASDYQVAFSSATGGSVTRSSDGEVINFSYTAATGAFLFQTATDPAAGPYTGNAFDGLTVSTAPGTTVVSGDRFLLKPFSTAASTIQAEFSSPRALAVASPIAGKMGATNAGSLQVVSLLARTNPPAVATNPVTIKFTGANSYTRSDDPVPATPTVYSYTSGQPIEGSVPPTSPLSEWSLTLQGAPKAGDTFTVVGIKDAANNNGIDFKLNAGNASALMGLRDLAMFDGSAMTDGYASLMSQIGIRVQSANYASETSGNIAANLERDRTAVSGVNLDEEAAKLLQYQQAYQASAKMIQIANSIFDTLIRSLG
jgi:flagellar hook-associated protein 1 FlgK